MKQSILYFIVLFYSFVCTAFASLEFGDGDHVLQTENFTFVYNYLPDDQRSVHSVSIDIYLKSNDKWVHNQNFIVTDISAFVPDYYSFNLSSNEKFLVIGFYYELGDYDPFGEGSVIIYNVNKDKKWIFDTKITGQDGFGKKVYVADDYVVVYGYLYTPVGLNCEPASIFKRTSNNWVKLIKFTPCGKINISNGIMRITPYSNLDYYLNEKASINLENMLSIDVNHDDKIGLEDLIYLLKTITNQQ